MRLESFMKHLDRVRLVYIFPSNDGNIRSYCVVANSVIFRRTRILVSHAESPASCRRLAYRPPVPGHGKNEGRTGLHAGVADRDQELVHGFVFVRIGKWVRDCSIKVSTAEDICQILLCRSRRQVPILPFEMNVNFSVFAHHLHLPDGEQMAKVILESVIVVQQPDPASHWLL